MRGGVHEGDYYDDDEGWGIGPYEALVFAERSGEIVPTLLSLENSIASDVDYITKFVKRLINTKRQLLALAPAKTIHRRRPNTQSVKVTKGGGCFLQCLQIDLDRILDKYPDIGTFNRYFGVFCGAVMSEVQFAKGPVPFSTVARREWLNSRDRDFFPDDVLALIVKYANEAIEQIRINGNTEKFKWWLSEIERQPKENEARLLSLIDASLAVNHHILALRFDLGYSQFYCNAERSGEMAVSYREMREHRVTLRRFLKRELKDRLLPGACKGMVFAIKLEYGLDKGYHFHALVVLNGDVVCSDIGITEMICNQWKYAITKGKGGACNCNLRLYKRKGIGSIKHTDLEKLDTLRKEVAPYIAKVDFYGKMVKPNGHRTFWSSHPPKITANPKGRKRKRSAGDIPDDGR